MSPRERFDILQASVDILRLTQAVEHYRHGDQWSWHFRGWIQWHAIGVIIAELGHNQNQQFVNNGWAVLDPILAQWDKVYRAKRDEPAWEHVNMLIDRARQKRDQMSTRQSVPAPTNDVTSHVSPSKPFTGFHSIWQTPWDSYEGPNPAMPALPDMSATQFNNAQVMPMMSCAETSYMTDLDSMPNLDSDFANFEGLENIDWSAFEGVFGDTAWDFPGTDTDVSMENFGS